jgi:hypothetical protein
MRVETPCIPVRITTFQSCYTDEVEIYVRKHVCIIGKQKLLTAIQLGSYSSCGSVLLSLLTSIIGKKNYRNEKRQLIWR